MINLDCEHKIESEICKLFDMVNEIKAVSKVSETEAAQAVQIVLGFLESKLPISVTDQIFAIFHQK